jgi:oxygen-independent coproporphyrinogen-3 oxidase
MYGLPGQTFDMFRDDLRIAISTGVQHISSYCLSYEENTPLLALRDQGKLMPADDDLCSQMFTLMCDTLRDGGYEHYEISNFCRPGFHSRHNSSYWDGTPYLGLGAGAHSYDGRSRQWNPSDLDAYMEGVDNDSPVFEIEQLSDADLYNEKIMLGLRTARGIDLSALSQKDRLSLLESARKFLSDGSLSLDGDYLRIPESDMFVSDTIISSLFC